MLIPVINRHNFENVAFSDFNELFLNIYSQLTKHKSLMLSTSFFLVCLTIMKHCRVQFSLYRGVNIRSFSAKRNQLQTAKTIIGKADRCLNYRRYYR